MIGCGLSVVGIWLIGTVFQTDNKTTRQLNNKTLETGCGLLVVGIWLVGSIQPTTDNRQRI